ncbi:MAG: PAS domain-containing protein [Planctomycetes bacterium]|nr:PAS domain-containing protein [Planctomycetota bacterium]
MFEMEPLVESHQRTLRGNRVLISLRLLFATLALIVLLLQESLSVGASLREGVRLPDPEGEVNALAYAPSGTLLASGGSDATVRIWDLESGSEKLATIEGHANIVRAVAFSPDGTKLASGSADGKVRIHETATGKFLGLIPHEAQVHHLAWSPAGDRLVLGGGDKGLRVWEVSGEQPREIAQTKGESEGRHTVFAAFLPGASRVISVGADGHVRTWKADTLEAESDIEAHLRPVQAAAISPDGRWLVTGGLIMKLWDLEKLEFVRAWEAHELPITALSFASDSERFLSASRDRKLMLWSVKQNRELKVFAEHTDWVLTAVLAPDARTAATGTGDRLIRLWDVESGKTRAEFQGHRPTLRAAYTLPSAKRDALTVDVPLYLRPVGLVVVIVLFLTIFYTWALRRSELAEKLAPLQIFVDVGLVSALVYHTGGVDSPFVTLYLVSVVSAAFVLSWRGAVLVACLTATLFSLLTLSYGLGFIPESYQSTASEAQLRKFRDLSPIRYVYLLLLPICGFFLVAFLSGYLSRSLTVARLLHYEVLEGLGEGILVLNRERQVIYHNHEIIRLLALTERPVKKSLKDLLGEHVDAQALRVLDEATTRRVEVANRRPDGIILPFEVKLKPFSEPGQPPHAIIVVVHDITAEKKMEEFFKHKERIEAMGQISASIAHEIRNPLASIRGAVQEIARSVEIPENKKILVEIVLSESDRLDQIITDFLKYARMRGPRLQNVEITELLRNLRLMLVSRAEAKDMQISLEAGEEIDPFLADPEQLRQIFLNFGVNAMQALEGRPDAKLVFKVRAMPLYQVQGLESKAVENRLNRPGVLIEITDNGPGIPEDVQAQIFEPFFTTKPSGTGLGLAIADRIVQGHEGLISFKSTEGQGTSFKIWLPSDLQPEAGEDLRKPVAERSKA